MRTPSPRRLLAGAAFSAVLASVAAAAPAPVASVDCGSLSTGPALRRVFIRQFCGGQREVWDASRCGPEAERRGFGREFPGIVLAADLARYVQRGRPSDLPPEVFAAMADAAREELVGREAEPEGCAERAVGAYAASGRVVAEDADALRRRAYLLRVLLIRRGWNEPEIGALLAATKLAQARLGKDGGGPWPWGERSLDPALGSASDLGPAPAISGPAGLPPILPAEESLPWSKAVMLRDAGRSKSFARWMAAKATGYTERCYRAVKEGMIAAGLLPGVEDPTQTQRIGIAPGDAYRLADALNEDPAKLDLTGLRRVDPATVPWAAAASELEGAVAVYDKDASCGFTFSKESGHVEVFSSCGGGVCPSAGAASAARGEGFLLCSDGCTKRPAGFFERAASAGASCLSLYVPVRPLETPPTR